MRVILYCSTVWIIHRITYTSTATSLIYRHQPCPTNWILSIPRRNDSTSIPDTPRTPSSVPVPTTSTITSSECVLTKVAKPRWLYRISIVTTIRSTSGINYSYSRLKCESGLNQTRYLSPKTLFWVSCLRFKRLRNMLRKGSKQSTYSRQSSLVGEASIAKGRIGRLRGIFREGYRVVKDRKVVWNMTKDICYLWNRKWKARISL